MRALALATLCASLALPSAARADEPHAPAAAPPAHAAGAAPAARAAGAAPATTPSAAPQRRTAPAPTPGAHPAVAAPPRSGTVFAYPPFGYGSPRYVFDPFFYSFAPLWWGWGWGWGYYPLYPRPQYGYPPEQVNRIATRLDVFGGGTLRHGGGAAGLAVSAEGERFGVDAHFDGFFRGNRVAGAVGTFGDSTATYGHGSAHLTAAIVATDVARLRVELGGAFLTWPDTGPDAGLAVGGPDLGVSGQLGLVGPLAFEGYARFMPVPVPVVDVLAALALRFGPVAVTAGWRELSVHKSDENAERFSFSGPQVGVGFLF
ncbi:MAG: hypothetical protein ACJ79L_09465 [Anaeromyxobacteraceae bacterium]